jgi:hypothetical protein
MATDSENDMSELNPTVQAVMKLLLEGGIEAAERYIASDLLQKVEEARALAVRLEQDLNAARNVVLLAKGQHTPVAPSLSVQIGAEAPLVEGKARVELVDEGQRRAEVLRAAHAVAAASPGGLVTTELVIMKLAEHGFVIPGARPGTSIGNMLNKDAAWKRLGEGAYTLEKDKELSDLI